MLKKLVVGCLFLYFSYPLMANSDNYELRRVVDAQGQLLNEYQQSISDLQREVDFLRGQLQETIYKLDQTAERQRMILKQIEESKGNLSGVAVDNIKRLDSSESTSIGWQASGDEKVDYSGIIEGVLKGNISDASILALEQFAQRYPDSRYLPNVNYWLGQLNYKKGRKKEASYYFACVVKKYPDSVKVADSMFKLGLILQEEGKLDKAAVIFDQVIKKYPDNATIIEQIRKTLKK